MWFRKKPFLKTTAFAKGLQAIIDEKWEAVRNRTGTMDDWYSWHTYGSAWSGYRIMMLDVDSELRGRLYLAHTRKSNASDSFREGVERGFIDRGWTEPEA